MNILVDGRPFVKTAAGISTFLRCVIVEWGKKRPQDSIYVFLPKALDKTLDLSMIPSNVFLLNRDSRLTNRIPNLLLLLLYIPFLCRKMKVDLYFAPVPCLPFGIPSKVKKLIVVHDVVNLDQAKTMELKNKIANKLFFFRSIKTADFIWTNSYYTKERVLHYIPERKCADIFTGCSVDRNLYKEKNLSATEIQNIKIKYGIKDKFILFVGSLEPRKNLDFLLKIEPILYEEYGIQLVVVGGKGWKNSSIKNVVEKDSYPKESTIFCGYITNEELVDLYNIANCFVSASVGEGFGMPQLEALLCECPVVTAHNTAMIEVVWGKTGAKTIKGFDSKEWVETIVKMVNEPVKPVCAELESYRWDTIVDDVLNYVRA